MELPPMSTLQEYQSEMMTIWEFLDNERPWWADKLGNIICVSFRVVGEKGIHRYVSVGSYQPPYFECYLESDPGKYAVLDGVGGFMGELMDLSIQFNLHKVFIKRSFNYIEYTVWLHRLEDGQERNIDADMVEKFCEKVFGK